MNATLRAHANTDLQLDEAIKAACDSIAPTWPLDRMIAVNPYWSMVDLPFADVAHQQAQLAGSQLTLPLAYYRSRWTDGTIGLNDLTQAVESSSTSMTVEHLIAALEGEEQSPTPPPLLCDSLDDKRDLQHEPAWCDTITHQVAQFCAAYFDQDQADWHPAVHDGIYQSWRETLCHDHSVALLMKAPQIPIRAATLAQTPREQIQSVLTELDVEPENWLNYLQAVIYRISGWAAWCAYQRWQARLSESEDDTLIHLLAIRLSWEILIDDDERQIDSVWHYWQDRWATHFDDDQSDTTNALLCWQRAHELSYQRKLGTTLAQGPLRKISTSPKIQAAFCIDVRSEVFRRHLEAQSDAIQTLGFAGFFGLPISYTPLGTHATRPQLPGLLAPSLTVSDSTGNKGLDEALSRQREQALKQQAGWQPFQALPASAFSLVETLGLGYVSKLIKRSLPGLKRRNTQSPGLSSAQSCELRPILEGDTEQRVTLAQNALIGMNLAHELAPLVLLVGHGSENRNNPQRAGLDCGACCGQAGDVNARALAEILNNEAVRDGLRERGITLAPETRFVAALHNTTTDEVVLFDTSLVSNDKLSMAKSALAAAGIAARAERAPLLGLAELRNNPDALSKAVMQRTNDWAQTRPEWGLANNAAFIIANRSRTRGLNLGGRTFLHEYDSTGDPDASLLAQIMTAPMVVTNWINMQYFASTVDNQRYGSGNKTLHNVVGGRLGVFEGNGGDLRIGLAKQSVHDGKQWQHEPLRLTVVIDAPQAAIESVINAHPIVRSLVANQWLYLARFDADKLAFYQQGNWASLD